MRIAAAVGACAEAFGAHWCLPGSGPLGGREAVDIAARHLGRSVKLRSVGLTTLRILGLLNRDLRGFLQVAPDYMKPVRYDARKLQGLLGRTCAELVWCNPTNRKCGTHSGTWA
jgi:hypothetical protein